MCLTLADVSFPSSVSSDDAIGRQCPSPCVPFGGGSARGVGGLRGEFKRSLVNSVFGRCSRKEEGNTAGRECQVVRPDPLLRQLRFSKPISPH